MHLDQPPAAGAGVQPVHVLRDEEEGAAPVLALQPHQRGVGGVGLHRGVAELRAAGVVEAVHPRRVPAEGVGRGDVLDSDLRPDPVGVAEGGEAALRGDPRAREDDDVHAAPLKRPPPRSTATSRR